MYTKENLKQMLKKSIKIQKSLMNHQLICDSTQYTEQNTEELNDVKDFIAYKIDLLNEVISLIRNFFAGNLHCDIDELFETLNFYKKQFNDISNDPRLSHLQQIYTRQVNSQTVNL